MTTPRKRNLRADVALALFDILEEGRSARDVLPSRQRGHDEQDKAWIQEMTLGVLRQLPLLQHWLRGRLDKPLKNRFKVTEHLIMLGFYQLAFSRVSTHAAVSETVNATKSLNVQPMKGLVNAVLRGFIRDEGENQLPDNPQILSGLPKWLYKRLASAYADQLPELIVQMNQKAPLWLRVNRTRCQPEAFAEALTRKGIAVEHSEQHADGLILNKSRDVTTLPGYAEGWFAVQDGAAQLAADYLNPQADERVLDCCAAPGGKTCHILERQSDVASVTALDVEQARMARVKENFARLGHQAQCIVGDAANPASWWDGQMYDRILLDAPCSATGIIRRHPDIKWLRKNADIDALVALQSTIFDAMWSLLKPGGTLLYATCSILPDENQRQVLAFLDRHPDARWQALNEDDSADWPGRQILPGEQQMDGFYYARLLKS